MPRLNEFFRENFWMEYAIVVLLTVLAGAAAAAGVARALDAAFGDAVSGLLGDAGEYQLVVHVRQDYLAAAERELTHLAGSRWPDVEIERGITVAGNANFFVRIPDRLLRQEFLEELLDLLGQVPGFNGHMWLLEPSLTVSGLRPGVQAVLAREAAAIPGVRLVVRHGSSVTVMLEHLESQAPVAARLKELVEGRQVLEVRFPRDFTGPGAEAAYAALGSSLVADVTVSEATGQAPLAVLRDVLRALAAQVRVTPAEGVQLGVGDRIVLQGRAQAPPVPGEAPDPEHLVVEVTGYDAGDAVGIIVQGDAGGGAPVSSPEASPPESPLTPGPLRQAAFRMEDGLTGGQAGEAVVQRPLPALGEGGDDPLGAGAPFGEALLQLAQTAREAAAQIDTVAGMIVPGASAAAGAARAERLARAIQAGDGTAAVREALFEVAAAAILRRLQPVQEGDDGAGAAADADVLNGLRQSLHLLADTAEELQRSAGGQALVMFAAVQRQLQALRDDEVTSLLRAVEGAAGGATGDNRLELLVDAGLSPAALEESVRRATGQAVTVTAASAGVVNPSPRSLVLKLLADVRRSVTGILALLVAAAALLLDHATVLAALRHLAVPARTVRAAGAGLGAFLLGCVYVLSGAELPFVGPGAAFLLGAGMGLVTAQLAERLSPVRAEEILAGQSLGLSDGQIMREIVVPAGRPGLLSFVNRRRRAFP